MRFTAIIGFVTRKYLKSYVLIKLVSSLVFLIYIDKTAVALVDGKFYKLCAKALSEMVGREKQHFNFIIYYAHEANDLVIFLNSPDFRALGKTIF